MIKTMETGIKFQRFGNNFSTPSTYQKIQPYLLLQFNKKEFTTNSIQVNYFSLTNDAERFNQNLRGEYIRATFKRNYVHPIFPNKFEFHLENNYLVKVSNSKSLYFKIKVIF